MSTSQKPQITVCPICAKDDKIQKVNSIYSAGTSAKSEVQVSHRVRGERVTEVAALSQTGLASRISPPERPELPFYASPTLLGGIGSLMTAIYFCGPWIVLVNQPRSLYSGPQSSPSGLGLALMFGIPLILIWFVLNRIGRKQIAPKLKVWELLRDKWLTLYYCSRDDVVFDPTSNQYASPEEISKLIQ